MVISRLKDKIILVRHARVDGHPLVLTFKYFKWIPAFAGMTNAGPQSNKSLKNPSFLTI